VRADDAGRTERRVSASSLARRHASESIAALVSRD
jgi:hypothetical protein